MYLDNMERQIINVCCPHDQKDLEITSNLTGKSLTGALKGQSAVDLHQIWIQEFIFFVRLIIHG